LEGEVEGEVAPLKQKASDQKLRGGYYTPRPISDFLARYAIRSANTKALEPSCGDGNVLEAAVDVFLDLGVSKKSIPEVLMGLEINPGEARRAISRLNASGIPVSDRDIIVGDFFRYCRRYLDGQVYFNAVIGNPPFIRYQNLSEELRTVAFDLMHSAGLHPNRLVNAWVPFLVGSTLLLADRGRLAMVIPAELLQVSYTAELRQFLSRAYSRITLITFKRLLFEGVQQEVVLFLGEKNGTERKGIRTIELEGIDDLATCDEADFSSGELKPLDHSTEKWTQYFLTGAEIELLRRLRRDPRLKRLGDVAGVDVGVVTGLNEFFILNQEKTKEYELGTYTIPIVCRSSHLSGIIFSKADLRANREKNYPSLLLNVPGIPKEKLSKSLRQYIEDGERRGLNNGYKCSIRDPWYMVPSVWTPDAFMLRQIHSYPKIILNETRATSTDTIHRVRFHSGTEGKALAAAFLNSLTLAFSEVIGRSYGGGVLELEPTEAENLPIPLIGSEKLDSEFINELAVSNSIRQVLDNADPVLLCDGLGLSIKETEMLRGIWEKLRDRRNGRRHTSTRKSS
jgi:adenine-specific DNA-methyltransferase